MKNLLVFVDCQEDFINENGKLPIKNAFKIRQSLSALNQINIQKLKTMDFHDENTKEISENPDYINTFPKHCMKDTDGYLLIPEISNYNHPNTSVVGWEMNEEIATCNINSIHEDTTVLLTKDKFDMFSGNKYTKMVLEKINADNFIVCGVATNICVDYAIKGLAEKKRVYIVIDAVMGIPSIPLKPIVEKWKELGVTPVIINNRLPVYAIDIANMFIDKKYDFSEIKNIKDIL